MDKVEILSWLTDEEVSLLYNFLLPRVHAMPEVNGRENAVREAAVLAERAASFNGTHLNQHSGLRYEGTECLMPVEPPVNQASPARFPITVLLPSPQDRVHNSPYQRHSGQLQRGMHLRVYPQSILLNPAALRFANPEDRLSPRLLDPALISSSMKSVLWSYRHNQAKFLRIHNENEAMLREHLADFGPHLPRDNLNFETLYTLSPPQNGFGMNSSSSYGQNLTPASGVPSLDFSHDGFLPVASAAKDSLSPLHSVLNQASGGLQTSHNGDTVNSYSGRPMPPDVSSGLQLSRSRGESQEKDIINLGKAKRSNALTKKGNPGGPNGVSKKANGGQAETTPHKYFPKAWERFSQNVKDELAKLPPPVLTEETKKLAAAAEAADRKKGKSPRRRGPKPMPDILPISNKAVEVLLKAGAHDNRPKAITAREATQRDSEKLPNITTRSRLSIANLVEGNEDGEEATKEEEQEE